VFYGLFSFVCFGPLTENFSATLAFGTPPLLQTLADRKEKSRNAQCNDERQRRDSEREVGHKQGMTMQGKLTMGLIAQKEDEADREERQMRFGTIEGNQRIPETVGYKNSNCQENYGGIWFRHLGKNIGSIK
jgi:hypothetical protein